MAVFKDFHPTQMQSTLEDSEAIKSSINNILGLKFLTIFGKPEFGTNLDQFIFEQMDFITRHRIEETVKSALYSDEPRITNIEVDIIDQPAYNRVFINVSFYIKGINTSEQVTIKLR